MSVSRLLTTITLALCSRTPSAMAEPGASLQQPASASVADSYAARVIFVNAEGDWVGLSQGIADLLSEHQISPHFEHRQAITEKDVLEPQGAPRSATVWIVMQDPGLVRLVFADPQTQHFLVRDIPLPQGLDELGRESIAQVVQSSTEALLSGSAGMSRAQVRQVLLPFMTHSAEDSHRLERRGTYPLNKSSKTAPSRWRVRLGPSYQASLTGKDFGPEHGPGIMAGVEYLRSTDSLVALGAFEWHFQNEHQNGEFQVAVQNSFAWLLLGWRKPKPNACLVALLGPGLQLARVRPTLVAQDAAASVGERLAHVRPWFRIATGFELNASTFALQLLGKVDLAAFRTHYDIENNGAAEHLASSWVVQPGIVLAALWR